MIWLALLYAILLASLLAFVFTIGLRNRVPWQNFWLFFLVLFLSIWGLSLWLVPVGPLWHGIAWLDLLIFGIILALLVSASTEAGERNYYHLRRGEVDIVSESKAEPGAIKLFGVFFWLFLAVMLVAIAIGVWRLLSA